MAHVYDRARAQAVVRALRKTVTHHEIGFEQSLGFYLLEQWDTRGYLTDAQMDAVEPIIAKYVVKKRPLKIKSLGLPKLRKKPKVRPVSTSI